MTLIVDLLAGSEKTNPTGCKKMTEVKKMKRKKMKWGWKSLVFASLFLIGISLSRNVEAAGDDVFVEPEEDKWTQITTTEEAMIPINENLSLRYNFGPLEALGHPFGKYSQPNLVPGDARKPTDRIAGQFVVPNATFVDTKTNSRIQHLYSMLQTGQGSGFYGDYLTLGTSLGLFYANKKDIFLDTVPINEFISGDVQYFKQILSNGMTAYKVAYDVAFPINAEKSPRKDHIEILMIGKKNGRVNVQYKVTNTGATDKNVVLGASMDTSFKRSSISGLDAQWTSNGATYNVPSWLSDAGIDNVPIRAVGDKKGVYIETEANKVTPGETSDHKYILKYLFDIPGAIDNWTGGQYAERYVEMRDPDFGYKDLFGFGRLMYQAGVPIFSSKPSDQIITLRRFNLPLHFFSHPTVVPPFTNTYLKEPGNGASDMPDLTSTGDEAKDWKAGDILKQDIDTAIHMKTQPKATFNSGDTIAFSYDVVVGISGSAPVVTLDQKNQDLVEGSSFDISGTWSDEESFYVDLYYTLDNSDEKIYIAKSVDNPIDQKGSPIPWGRDSNAKVTIPADKLPLGSHTIKVYAVDSEQNVSQPAQVVVTVKAGKADVTVQFVDENGEKKHENVIFPEQKLGTEISINTPEIQKILAPFQEDYLIEGPLDSKNQLLNPEKVPVNQGGTVVTYRINGIKQLIVPQKIDFESQTAEPQEKIAEEPVVVGKLAVKDTRVNKKSWLISARMKKDLTNRENGIVVKNLVQYRKKAETGEQMIPLVNDFQTVASGTNQALEYSVSDQWKPNGDGVKLKFKRTDLQSLGDYDGIIEWNIVDGPDGKLLP